MKKEPNDRMRSEAQSLRLSRRDFLGKGTLACALLFFTSPEAKAKGTDRFEARYYERLPKGRIRCHLCPWECMVAPGARGTCEVRENQNGTYYSLVYGQVASRYNDPIEKKPFFHVLPGRMAYSIATAGCNVACKFCQNWELAQRRPEEVPAVFMRPEAVVEAAVRAGSAAIAYTYSEPTVFTEFVIDVATLAREKGLRNVVVSNGFINAEPLEDLCRVLDAYKVDLKAFTESYYGEVVGGSLSPVLDTLRRLKRLGIWTEIVYLVVPSLNDSEKEIRAMCQWVLSELGPDVPVHFSRFYPQYKLRNLPPTPVSTLERAWRIGQEVGLHFVYVGNVPGHPGEHTVCPSCGKTLIARIGYRVRENHLRKGRCAFCGRVIPGVWEA